MNDRPCLSRATGSLPPGNRGCRSLSASPEITALRASCRGRAILAALAVLIAAPASGLQPAPGSDAPYTLGEALRDALERDPRIRAAGSRVSEAGEELAEVRSLRLPTISLVGGQGYGYSRSEARSIGVYEGDSRSSGLEVNQTIYSFGRIGSRQREARALIATAEFEAADTRQSIMADVAEAYAGQIYNRRILDRRIEFEGLVRQQEDSVREQLALGRSDQTQIYEVLRYLHQAKAYRIEAETAYQRAKFELARLTGAIRGDLDATGLSSLERRLPATLGVAKARGREEAPVAGKARQSVVVAKSRMEFQRAEFWPSLELKLGGSNGHVGEISTRDANAQLLLRMPLFEGGKKFARLRKARYVAEAAEYNLAADLEQLELDITVGWNLANGLAQTCLELEQSLEDAAEIVSLVEQRLLAGRGTVLDRLEAEEIVANTDVSLLEKRLELASARARLLYILGVLSPTL